MVVQHHYLPARIKHVSRILRKGTDDGTYSLTHPDDFGSHGRAAYYDAGDETGGCTGNEGEKDRDPFQPLMSPRLHDHEERIGEIERMSLQFPAACVMNTHRRHFGSLMIMRMTSPLFFALS